MAQSYPENIENLSQTYFGELGYQFSGKSSVVTQDLSTSYFGKCIAGNDWSVVVQNVFLPMIMMI